jgi:hypothetical protein
VVSADQCRDAKLVKFGTQPVQFQAGLRYWADNPDTGAHDLGARFNVIFLFPTAKVKTNGN